MSTETNNTEAVTEPEFKPENLNDVMRTAIAKRLASVIPGSAFAFLSLVVMPDHEDPGKYAIHGNASFNPNFKFRPEAVTALIGDLRKSMADMLASLEEHMQAQIEKTEEPPSPTQPAGEA